MDNKEIVINKLALQRLRSLYNLQRDYGHRYIDNDDYYYKMLWEKVKIEYDATLELIVMIYDISEEELLKIVQAR